MTPSASAGNRSADRARRKGRFLYLLQKSDTPGCTTQSCGLRDVAPQVGDTAIIGISPDKPAAQKKFDTKYGLGFTLLSDEDHAVADAYDAWGERSMYPKKYMGIIRSAFLIDENGTIEQAWPRVSPKDTPTNLLKASPADPSRAVDVSEEALPCGGWPSTSSATGSPRPITRRWWQRGS